MPETISATVTPRHPTAWMARPGAGNTSSNSAGRSSGTRSALSSCSALMSDQTPHSGAPGRQQRAQRVGSAGEHDLRTDAEQQEGDELACHHRALRPEPAQLEHLAAGREGDDADAAEFQATDGEGVLLAAEAQPPAAHRGADREDADPHLLDHDGGVGLGVRPLRAPALLCQCRRRHPEQHSQQDRGAPPTLPHPRPLVGTPDRCRDGKWPASRPGRPASGHRPHGRPSRCQAARNSVQTMQSTIT